MVDQGDRLLCRELIQKRGNAGLRRRVVDDDKVGDLHGIGRQYRIEAAAHGHLTPIDGDDDVESIQDCLSHSLFVLSQSARDESYTRTARPLPLKRVGKSASSTWSAGPRMGMPTQAPLVQPGN